MSGSEKIEFILILDADGLIEWCDNQPTFFKYMSSTAEKRYTWLVLEAALAAHYYYVGCGDKESDYTDFEYDQLYNSITCYEKIHPDCNDKLSPTKYVDGVADLNIITGRIRSYVIDFILNTERC